MALRLRKGFAPGAQRSIAAFELEQRPSARKKLEDEFAFQLRAHKLPACTQQLRFAVSIGRQWPFDFAFPEYRLAIEIDGLSKNPYQGGHQTHDGIRRDMEKGNAAVLLGWRVLHFEQGMLKSGAAIDMTQRVLATLGWKP